MRKLAEAGFGDMLVAPDPLSPAAALAAHCWGWCDGWHPERWEVYAALHEVDDWHQLADLMRAIRDAHAARDA